MLNRRDFLLSSSAALLSSCASGLRFTESAFTKEKKTKYFIATQSHYWGKAQNLADMPATSKLALSDALTKSTDRFTILTSVNDDGTNLRRVQIPLMYHCASSSQFNGNPILYLMGNHRPSALLALNANSLEMINCIPSPTKIDTRNFGGHGIPLPGKNAVAFTMNNFELGKFDEISIRDPKTLVEIQKFSTYGFQAHEIRLSEDGKYFICGHYGSYLGQGIYKGLGIYNGNGYVSNSAPPRVYPSSVTLVDTKNGDRFKISSDVKSGQEGHATADGSNSIYLPNVPARLNTRPALEVHPRFQEGKFEQAETGEFQTTDLSLGISVIYDPRFNEVIVPHRSAAILNITNASTQMLKSVDLSIQAQKLGLDWIRTEQDFLNGLEFHPDGIHYIISTSSGIIAVIRGTHIINPKMTFALTLQVHSHMHILTS